MLASRFLEVDGFRVETFPRVVERNSDSALLNREVLLLLIFIMVYDSHVFQLHVLEELDESVF